MFERCLYFNANHLSRVVNKLMNDAYASIGLSAAHAYLLRLVLDNPGLLQKEIGSMLHLEKSTITRFINKMVDEGYLLRKPSIIDEIKYQHIYPTTKALKIKTELDDIGEAVYKQMAEAINPSEFVNIVDKIRKVTHKL